MTSRILRWLVGLLILVLIGVRLSIFTVRQGEVGVVERFGEVRRVITDPGWYSKWFWPFERAHRFDNRRRVFSPTYVETLTRDQRNIIVWSYVVWSIDETRLLQYVESFRATKLDPERVVEEAESNLNSIILDAQNAVLGSYDLGALVSVNPQQRKIEIIEEDVVRAARPDFQELGIRLHQFGFKRLALPESTVQEALDQMRVKRHIVAQGERGKGELAARHKRAETKLAVSEIIAEARKRAAEIRGRGEADTAKILMEAHQLDPAFYAWLRHLEAVRRSITERTMLILDTRSAPLSVLKEPGGPQGAATPAAPTSQPARTATAGEER